MFCPKCGAENPENARFCGECGCDIQKELQKEQSISEKVKGRDAVKNEKNLIIGLFAVILVAAVFFAWQMIAANSEKEEQSVSESTTTETSEATSASTEAVTEASTEEERTESESEGKNQKLPLITSQSQANYNNILDLDDYETFYAGDYSFGYPKKLYKSVVQVGNSYEFQSDSYNYVTFRRESLESGTTVKKKLKSSYDQVRKNLTDRNEILYKEDTGLFVIAGRQKGDTKQSCYYLVRIENGYLYSMTIGYRHTSDKTEDKKQNYYIDTMYRMCSFGRGTYQPRTYQQFLNDDMGTKK